MSRGSGTGNSPAGKRAGGLEGDQRNRQASAAGGCVRAGEWLGRLSLRRPSAEHALWSDSALPASACPRPESRHERSVQDARGPGGHQRCHAGSRPGVEKGRGRETRHSTLTAVTKARRWRRWPRKHLPSPGRPKRHPGRLRGAAIRGRRSARRCKPGRQQFIRRATYPRRTLTNAAMWPRVLPRPMWCWKRLTAPSASCTLPSSRTAAWPTGREAR